MGEPLDTLIRWEHAVERALGLHPPPDSGGAEAVVSSGSAATVAAPRAVAASAAPSVASNPPPPAGYSYMPQADVTPEMAAWSSSILRNQSYANGATEARNFGSANVLARVEWHPADAHIPHVHRGVSLFEAT